jgi:hypothetical protein
LCFLGPLLVVQIEARGIWFDVSSGDV